jgi:hypothetical protein
MGSHNILPIRPASAPAPPPASLAAAPRGQLPPVRLFLFRRIGGGPYALTADPGGRNLPPGLGAGDWTFLRRLDVVRGEVRVDLEPDAVFLAVSQDGYALIASPHHVD